MSLVRLLRVLMGVLLCLLLQVLRSTWRVRVSGAPPRGGQLMDFWHEQQLAPCACPPRPAPAVLVSWSHDGTLASVARLALGGASA